MDSFPAGNGDIPWLDIGPGSTRLINPHILTFDCASGGRKSIIDSHFAGGRALNFYIDGCAVDGILSIRGKKSREFSLLCTSDSAKITKEYVKSTELSESPDQNCPPPLKGISSDYVANEHRINRAPLVPLPIKKPDTSTISIKPTILGKDFVITVRFIAEVPDKLGLDPIISEISDTLPEVEMIDAGKIENLYSTKLQNKQAELKKQLLSLMGLSVPFLLFMVLVVSVIANSPDVDPLSTMSVMIFIFICLGGGLAIVGFREGIPLLYFKYKLIPADSLSKKIQRFDDENRSISVRRTNLPSRLPGDHS
ncbi:hypothetical protein [Kocuria marina]|uniref:hypothetical protein n=1 Tax=Kocuria marina TaxID=223184 RepID=UPI0022E03527|nr:hypothetical protein [Kocuria marina]